MIAGLGLWDWAAIAAGTALLVYGIKTEWPRLASRRGRARTVSLPAAAEPDDYPTAPIPVIPAEPAPKPEPEMRLMLRRDELLWAKSGDDPEGVITLGLLPEPGGQLGVLMDDNGIAIGVRLDRREVQGLRDAITNHLINTSKPVRP